MTNITWEQAIKQAHDIESRKVGAHSDLAKELGAMLLDVENMPAPKTEKPIYGAKVRIRSALKGATSKDLARVIETASEMLLLIQAEEERREHAQRFQAAFYNLWSQDPQGQTFEQFLSEV